MRETAAYAAKYLAVIKGEPGASEADLAAFSPAAEKAFADATLEVFADDIAKRAAKIAADAANLAAAAA